MNLPPEITKHLPEGYQPSQGVWFVLPESDGKHDGIATVNSLIHAEDWEENMNENANNSRARWLSNSTGEHVFIFAQQVLNR